MLLTTRKIRMDLARQERVLGDIGPAGVVVEGQKEKPDHAGDNAQEREDVREPDEEEGGVVPQIAD